MVNITISEEDYTSFNSLRDIINDFVQVGTHASELASSRIFQQGLLSDKIPMLETYFTKIKSYC